MFVLCVGLYYLFLSLFFCYCTTIYYKNIFFVSVIVVIIHSIITIIPIVLTSIVKTEQSEWVCLGVWVGSEIILSLLYVKS